MRKVKEIQLKLEDSKRLKMIESRDKYNATGHILEVSEKFWCKYIPLLVLFFCFIFVLIIIKKYV